MLTNLLRTLSGTHPPTALARSAQTNWRDWLQPLSDTAAAGTDPSYDDDFLALKEELAKLSGIDDTRVIELAEGLLRHTAKDARVAVYYLYGRMRRDGAQGVAEGFELLAALLERFGETLLPQRTEARKAALEWLASATFTERLEQVRGLDGVPLERTLSALALASECLASWPDPARPELGPLLHHLNQITSAAATTGTGQPHQQTDTSPSSTPTASAGISTLSTLTSSRDLLDQARQMAQFLRAQPQGYAPACRLIRCARWDLLTELPPHDATGRTRLAAPRPELRAHLKRLLLQQQWGDLLEDIEAAFAEAANHFWLDLQHEAFIAQHKAGGVYADARERAVTDCALMLERLPGLERLAFSDGTPFASDATLDWIASHASVRDLERGEAIISIPTDTSSTSTDWAETEIQASEIATQQGLDAAFAWLQRLPVCASANAGERERFIWHRVMARVAEQAGRPDTALHLLTLLDTTLARFNLSAWEPALAFDTKQHRLRLLQARAQRRDADSATLARQIDTLLSDLTALDAARAVTLTG
ncbi:type VI secretion system protein TssA [Paraburkholderia bonniea]|uniref:type VI secretion system protein TssA n=1 Tax=Paraburkholderia bonniea TaxID=2152891 RepID=UPI0025741DB6|nr:type VI secretion system protein TssA [Paraburkholderia bonniea]WJF90235.1 type VI secretion system protein TssA [Paraburkholderia bonniea]WJF93549.1 type VI secretion system protein TssA [Paraburkholderia bonniea]